MIIDQEKEVFCGSKSSHLTSVINKAWGQVEEQNESVGFLLNPAKTSVQVPEDNL